MALTSIYSVRMVPPACPSTWLALGVAVCPGLDLGLEAGSALSLWTQASALPIPHFARRDCLIQAFFEL